MFHIYLVDRQAHTIRPAYLSNGKPVIFKSFSAAQDYVRQCTNEKQGVLVEYKDK